MQNDELFKQYIIENPIISKTKIIGYIYLFYNKSNQKLYVGKTVNKFNLRWNEHKYNAFTKLSKNYFYNALRKYTWEGFERYVIFQTEELDNKQEVDTIIINKEIEFIKLFNSNNPKFGYNGTTGGDGIVGYKHTDETKLKCSLIHKGENHHNYGNFNNSTSFPVLQFDLNFNLIKEWPSMQEIEREHGYKSNNISRCCSGELKTYYNYIWIKKENYKEGCLNDRLERINIMKTSISKYAVNNKFVLQYDFLGNFIKKHPSASDAAREFKCDSSTISGAANGKFKHGKSYIWIYEKDFNEELLKDKIELVKDAKNYNTIIQNLKTIRDYE